MFRTAGVTSPLQFGRREPFTWPLPAQSYELPEGLKLFLLTYAAGFLGVSLFIA